MAANQMADAHVRGLSTDTRFALAYNAARLLAVTVVRASGYRVREHGGAHYNTFQALMAVDKSFEDTASYLEICRTKRNTLLYDRANVVTSTEAEELLMKLTGFGETVRSWVGQQRPDLM
jgi:hypothetical protein